MNKILQSLFLSGFACLGAAVLATAADAAVAVTGEGPAHYCYLAARTGSGALEGIRICDQALDDSMLSRVDRAGTYDNRGVLEATIGQNELAMRDYDRSLSISPDLGDAHLNRGAVYIVQRQFDQAMSEIELGIKDGLTLPENGYYDRAIAEEGLGRIDDAYRDYKKALEVAPYFTSAAEQLKRFTVVKSPQGGG